MYDHHVLFVSVFHCKTSPTDLTEVFVFSSVVLQVACHVRSIGECFVASGARISTSKLEKYTK